MATDKELSDFLASVEKRAFKQAAYAVRRDESALDIVQDAMIKLAEKYGDRPVSELPMLFQRILQNTISDFFRREKVVPHKGTHYITGFFHGGKHAGIQERSTSLFHTRAYQYDVRAIGTARLVPKL